LEKLTEVYASKAGYTLPRAIMTNTDVQRIINSEEIQSAIRVQKTGSKPKVRDNTNPLRSKIAADRLAVKQLF